MLVSTAIPATLQAVQTSWRSVEIPVVLITAQLLVACLLLLFLSVTDAIDARGHEVSLAKLRGRGGWRTIVFGMSEPVLLLALALPAGVLAGWAATAALSRVLLRPGTAVVLPPLAWATAGLATAGGLLAVVLAARRTLRRPVLEEWRRSGRNPAGRGWVVDAVLATGAAAGLLDLAVSGQIRLGPAGVLGPARPRAAGAGRRRHRLAAAAAGLPGGLRPDRHPRRPRPVPRPPPRGPPPGRDPDHDRAGHRVRAEPRSRSRAWAVGRSNQHLVAAAEVGAPAVLTVGVPAGREPRDHRGPGRSGRPDGGRRGPLHQHRPAAAPG